MKYWNQPPAAMFDPRQQHYAPPPQPTRKRRRWPFVVVGFVTLLGVLAMGAVVVLTQGAQVSNPPAAPMTVVYEVEGVGTAGNITYMTDGTASVAEEASVRLPWRKEVQVVQRGVSATTVTAQNKSSGEIRCRITVDGKVIKEVASSGLFTVVSCAGPA
jgi:hypothetical protein